VDSRILEGKNFYILFGFNRGDKNTKAEFGISVKGQNYTARNLESKEKILLRFQNNTVILEKVLEPGEIWVVVIEQK